MRSRLPSWILLLYLAIDLTNPFVPGAFRFTLEEGFTWVEGTSHPREEAKAGTSETMGSAPPPRKTALESSLGKPPQAWYLTSWLVRVRTSDPPARDLPPSDSDDH
jgi:hypothetical protein